MFEGLPEEVQSNIFYRSGKYNVAKKYYEGMSVQLESDCLRPITGYEIKYNIFSHDDATFMFPFGTYLRTFVYGSPNGLSVNIVGGSVSFFTTSDLLYRRSKHTEITSIEFGDSGIRVSDIPRPRQTSVFGGSTRTVFTTTTTGSKTLNVSYDELLLAPQIAMNILNNR